MQVFRKEPTKWSEMKIKNWERKYTYTLMHRERIECRKSTKTHETQQTG